MKCVLGLKYLARISVMRVNDEMEDIVHVYVTRIRDTRDSLFLQNVWEPSYFSKSF